MKTRNINLKKCTVQNRGDEDVKNELGLKRTIWNSTRNAIIQKLGGGNSTRWLGHERWHENWHKCSKCNFQTIFFA